MDKFTIKNPIVSEKAAFLGELRKYVFLVRQNSTAPEIKKTIETIYGVNIIDMNIITVKPKRRRLGRTEGIKSGYKKAIVTLKEGQKLDVIPH